MKRLAICLLALLLVFPCMSALAGDYLGAMCVVNCEEWVSLRLLPDAQSDVVARVPYEAVVLAYYENEEFTRCYYDSRWGYIQNQYLEMEEPYIPDRRSSAEQELQSSDFFQRYPDYEAFDDNYANTVHMAGWRRMGFSEHFRRGARLHCRQLRIFCLPAHGGRRADAAPYGSSLGDSCSCRWLLAWLGAVQL